MRLGGLPWQLRLVVDERGRDAGFCFLRGYLPREYHPLYDELSTTHQMLGLTSYGPFPLFHEAFGPMPADASPEDGWNRPEVAALQGWAHCFREPSHFLPDGPPRALISESDFVDVNEIWEEGRSDGRGAKRWDLVYSCGSGSFQAITKNWPLAKRCLHELSRGGLRILVVGRAGTSDLPVLPGVEYLPRLKRREYLQYVARAKAAFVPSRLDASPRVIVEALALDVPVLVNESILGGWKYVSPETGEFFGGADDVVSAAWSVLGRKLAPRGWFVQRFGRNLAQRRLAAFLSSLPATSASAVTNRDLDEARLVG